MKLKNLLEVQNILWGLQEKDVFHQITHSSGDEIIQGQFSFAFEDETYVYFVRDRIGLNKLFYNIDEKNEVVVVSNSLFDLAVTVGDFNSIFSVPAGHYLKINKKSCEKQLSAYFDANRRRQTNTNFDIDSFREKVKEKLEGALRFLHKTYSDHQFFVCLSGGLDSTIIADVAKRVLRDNVQAVTFSYSSVATIKKMGSVIVNPDVEAIKDSGLSEDFMRASGIAKILGLDHIAVLSERTMDLEILDEVLKNGQDWRDFNVHCAWVNHIIGSNIRKFFPGKKVIFLTGDLMNEFVVDYTAVEYKESVYYSLPRITKEKLRKYFVLGLDAGDREIGIFSKQGAITIQPFSVVAEEYLSIPPDYLEKKDCKQILNSALLSDPQLLSLISSAKIRAQVGGKDGGTLGLFHDAGITQRFLKSRWEEIFSQFTKGEKVSDAIYAGRYRWN